MVFSILDGIQKEMADYSKASQTNVYSLIEFIYGIMRYLMDPLNSIRVILIKKIKFFFKILLCSYNLVSI